MENRVSRPNVLLITCDQWRGDCLSAAGHPVVKTPHVDALAAEGVLFQRHYGGAAP
ncbi:MAG: phosphonate monoester hydrolase, partial [Mesorhizobium sp.]